MVNITDKSKCCGCNACGDVCIHQAIKFHIDVEGFWYPEVDKDKCTDCGLCEKVCPIINKEDWHESGGFEKPHCYALINKNIEVRFDSTSGGAFSALADEIYKKSGYVGGAIYNEDWSVSQFLSSSREDLSRLRSSKYLQSHLDGFYIAVREALKTGKPVLVCGSPCQMAAMKRFLRKPYENLMVVDYICRGIASPLYFKQFINYLEQKHHSTGRDDTFLCIPPLYHTGAKFHWMGSLVAGSKAVLLKGTKPEQILSAVSSEHCTIVWLLVPWAQDILDALDSGKIKLSDYNLSQWRLMHIGAQPVPPSLIKRWRKYFPNHQYDTNYGLSESTGPGCVHLGVENIDKVGAIGIPGYGWECKIVDENDNEVCQGEVGELCVKGPGVMTCYYRNEAATKEVLKDGWLYTGDMAMQDKDGFYFLVDRKKDVIVSGGENIYPVQIEDFLRRFHKIKDAAVIGLPDRRLGEKTAAIIEIKDGVSCTEEEIEKFCLELPRYKRPKQIIFADIPRNATGKIEKPKLRKIYGADKLVAMENKA